MLTVRVDGLSRNQVAVRMKRTYNLMNMSRLMRLFLDDAAVELFIYNLTIVIKD